MRLLSVYYSYFQICNAKSMSSILVILASYSCLESLWVTSEGGLVPYYTLNVPYYITSESDQRKSKLCRIC